MDGTYNKLEGLNQAHGLVDRAANWKVVNGDLTEDTLGIDNEKTTQSDALLLNQNVVVFSNLVVGVRNQGKLEVRTEATLVARLRSPGEMSVLRIGGSSCATNVMVSRVREREAWDVPRTTVSISWN